MSIVQCAKLPHDFFSVLQSNPHMMHLTVDGVKGPKLFNFNFKFKYLKYLQTLEELELFRMLLPSPLESDTFSRMGSLRKLHLARVGLSASTMIELVKQLANVPIEDLAVSMEHLNGSFKEIAQIQI